jgi:acyl-[acyl-carrier-protein] desaturase
MYGRHEAFATWTRRWTAEEGRHSIVIRDYLTATRAIDPVVLERGRMAQVSGGQTPTPPSPVHGLVYLSIQEMATNVAHRNTGRVIGDPTGAKVMARVAGDENLHQRFYRDLTGAAIELDPSALVLAIETEVRDFAMPGTGIPGFNTHAALIARAGIYDLAVHYEQILVPVVFETWKVTELTGLTSEAELARDRLVSHIERTGRVGRQLAERRTAADTLVGLQS